MTIVLWILLLVAIAGGVAIAAQKKWKLFVAPAMLAAFSIVSLSLIYSRPGAPVAGAPSPATTPTPTPEELEKEQKEKEDQEAVLTEQIKDGPRNAGWRFLTVVEHRRPPYENRKTVFEKEYDPKVDGTVLTDLNLSLLEAGHVTVTRLTDTLLAGDIAFRFSSPDALQPLYYDGGTQHFTLSEKTASFYLEPDKNAGMDNHPARIQVVAAPRPDLRAIWIKTEEELVAQNEWRIWGKVPGNVSEYGSLAKVTVRAQAFRPGQEGKPFGGEDIKSLSYANVPRLQVVGVGDSVPVRSDGSAVISYDPTEATDLWLSVGIYSNTGFTSDTDASGAPTLIWRITVRCDWKE